MTPGVKTMAGHLQPLQGTACSGCGQAYLPAVLPARYSTLADRAPELTQQALGWETDGWTACSAEQHAAGSGVHCCTRPGPNVACCNPACLSTPHSISLDLEQIRTCRTLGMSSFWPAARACSAFSAMSVPSW